jgi:hypothetical protein
MAVQGEVGVSVVDPRKMHAGFAQRAAQSLKFRVRGLIGARNQQRALLYWVAFR